MPAGRSFIHCQGPNWNHFLLAELGMTDLYEEVLSVATTADNEVNDLVEPTSTTRE